MENSVEMTEKNEEEVILVDENSTTSQTEASNIDESKLKSPTADKKAKCTDLNLSITNSAEKLSKNLKMQQKIENAKKRQEEKEKRDKEKKEKEELRLKREEELKKKKEEEEKLRLKRLEEKEKQTQERLEKERKRQEQINVRNEEKRKRDEEKKKLDDEKKRMDEEKQREEEEKKRKAEKVKTQFSSFFIKKEKTSNPNDKEEQKSFRFMPFQLKPNMHLAPICRRNDIANMTNDQKDDFINNIDNLVNSEEKPSSYLKELNKNGNQIRKGYKSIRKRNNKISKTVELKMDETSNEEIKLISSSNIISQNNFTKYKVKYLHFDPKQNRRPPYYGTWKKKSNLIRPKNPFAKDEKIIDYEVDSDDEWEDEADGESIADSDKGDPEEEALNGDDEDDDGFFVPHGHLSDDEMDEDERNLDVETKKAREAAKSEQWETERKKTSKHLIPKIFFINEYWNVPDKLDLDSVRPELKLLHKYQIVPLLTPLPIVILNEAQIQAAKAEEQINKANKANSENISSPNPTPRSKSNKQKANLNNSTIQSPSNNSTQNTTNLNKGSIINFISKLSNKTCKVEQVVSTSADTTPAIEIINTVAASPSTSNPIKSIITTLSSSVKKADKQMKESDTLMDTIDSVIKNSNSPSISKNTPSVKLRKENSCVLLNKGSPSTPLNSKPTGPTSTTAEKRACNENGESAVKRLKLDDDQPTTSQKSSSKTASPTILSLFKQTTCRKNLRLSACEIDITLPEEESSKFTNAVNKNSKLKTDDSIMSPKKNSINTMMKIVDDSKLVKTDVSMDTSETLDKNELNNKENNKSQVITID